jgi:hypothetical protein
MRMYSWHMALCRQWGRLSKYYDDQLRLAEQQASSATADALKDQQTFRQANQLKDTRREWDLNRPDAKLLDRPAREGDDDERCGMSSLQVPRPRTSSR